MIVKVDSYVAADGQGPTPTERGKRWPGPQRGCREKAMAEREARAPGQARAGKSRDTSEQGATPGQGEKKPRHQREGRDTRKKGAAPG